MDHRLETMDQRLETMDHRLETMDHRLETMDQRLETMDQRLDTLAGEVQSLRVLEEENSTQIRLVAEVQTHHGRVLEQIVRDLEPLKVLPDLFKQVAQDHERRITTLERNAGGRPWRHSISSTRA
jgi:chromosome segregation ATPase